MTTGCYPTADFSPSLVYIPSSTQVERITEVFRPPIEVWTGSSLFVDLSLDTLGYLNDSFHKDIKNNTDFINRIS